MFDMETMQYLRSTFGTFKFFDCKKCSKRSACTVTRYSRGGSFCCALSTYASLFELKRCFRVDPDNKSNYIIKKMAKLEMLGFKPKVIAPFIIMRNNEKYFWVYPEKLTCSDKIYDYVGIYGNFVVCTLNNKTSAFFISNLKVDLLETLPDIGIMLPYDRAYASNLEVLLLKYTCMGKPCDLLVNTKGNRALIMGMDIAVLDTRSNFSLLSGSLADKSGGRMSAFARLDKNLKVIDHSKGIVSLDI